jgi:alkanesulfonate monooxygenase SsuD/methylene tetrahydromethanopterin reductase-like flavin-dependent oxidoreductase (luciferase family)
MDRMARWGEGYIGGSVPAPMAAPAFDAARDAWRRAGRKGSPRLVALAYVALGDSDKGRQNVHDFYRLVSGEFAGIVAGAVCDSPAKVKESISSFADAGIDEIAFNPATDDLDEVKRLADVVF